MIWGELDYTGFALRGRPILPEPTAPRNPPTMPAQAVLFDLDGTLLDTLADIASAANAALALESMPTHPAAS